MPGKVNPMIPEAVTQAACWCMATTSPSASPRPGSLELNAFLPLIAHCLLESGIDC